MRRGSPRSTSSGANRFSCERLELRLMLDGVTDHFANSLDDAAPIDLAADFPQAAIVGTIHSSFDQDVYRFIVPDQLGTTAPLLLTVRQRAVAPSDGLDSVLSVFNGAGMMLVSSDDAAGTTDAELSLLVLPGSTYYVQAAGFYDSTGDYRITLDFAAVSDELPSPSPDFSQADDYPSSPVEAVLEPLNARGLMAWAGSLERPDDVDAFRFTSAAAGAVLVRAVRFPAGGFVGHLEIVDENGVVVASADDNGDVFAATEASLSVASHATYGIRVSGLDGSYGEYSLIVSPLVVQDDYGDIIATAYRLTHPSSGHSYLRGTIDSADDVDFVQLTIGAAGTTTVVVARHDSALEADPELLDAAGEPLPATALAATVEGEQRFEFEATAGQTIYVRIAGQAASSGEYSLDVTSQRVATDDFPDDEEHPPLFELSPTGFGAQSGSLDGTTSQGTDLLDFFDVVSPLSGVVYLERTLPGGIVLGADVEVYEVTTDNEGQEVLEQIAFLNAADVTAEERVIDFAVTAGDRYRIFVVRQGGSGGYQLTFRGEPDAPPALDEPGTAFASAPQIVLPEGGVASVAGAIDSSTDLDYYKFMAPFTGKVLVSQSAGVSGLHSHLIAYDEAFAILANNEGHDGELDALVAFEITEGKTYYLSSSAIEGLGPYALSLRAIEGGLKITPLGAPHDGGTLNAVDLVMELLGDSLASDSLEIDLDTIEYLGAEIAAGLFSGAGDLFASEGVAGFDRGIILTTGEAANAIGPNFATGSQQDNGITSVDPNYADLVAQLTNGKPAFDASILAFSFTPETDVIQLRFVFASEEYPEYVLKGFSDVFGVFVNEVNYARVPGTDNYIAGTGEVISIDTINQVSHAEFFVDNAVRDTAPFGPLDIEYDGLTTVITLTIPVRAGKPNDLVLVIADVNDRLNDSAVFVQAASLSSPREAVDTPSGEALLDDFADLVDVVDGMPADATPDQQHLAIHQQFIYEFLKQLGVPLVGGVLVIAVDPVDYTLLGPNGIVGTVDRNRGQVDLPNAFYTSNGTEDLIVIPNAALEDYSVQFAGGGSSDFRFGASYIEPNGAVTTRLWQSAPNAPYTVAVAFDFRKFMADDLARDVVVESISLTENLPPQTTAAVPSLDGVFFAVATSGRAPVTQTSLTTATNTGGGDDSSGGEGGGSSAGGEAAPNSTRLANSSGAGGKVRTGRPGALDVISLYLDEILREIGVGGDDPNTPPSPRLRSFLRALLFRVHVPFLFPLDLGGEAAPSTTAPAGESSPTPQAELPTPPSRDELAQATTEAAVAEHSAGNPPATAADDLARSTVWNATTHQPHSDFTTLSSPRRSAAPHTRLLSTAAVALCLSLAVGSPWPSNDDRRRQLRSRVEHRSLLGPICRRERRSVREHGWLNRLLRGHLATQRAKAMLRHSTRRSGRRRFFLPS